MLYDRVDKGVRLSINFQLLPICVNLAEKVEHRKSAGKGQVEIVLKIRIPSSVPSKQF
jgi:hypothetical protein